MVKVLSYKSDGPGIDSRWCHWIFQQHIPSDRSMALGSTQPLVKMSTRNISWGQRRPVREADLTTFMCRISWKSGSLNLLEPSGPHQACYGAPLCSTFYMFHDLVLHKTYCALSGIVSTAPKL